MNCSGKVRRNISYRPRKLNDLSAALSNTCPLDGMNGKQLNDEKCHQTTKFILTATNDSKLNLVKMKRKTAQPKTYTNSLKRKFICFVAFFPTPSNHTETRKKFCCLHNIKKNPRNFRFLFSLKFNEKMKWLKYQNGRAVKKSKKKNTELKRKQTNAKVRKNTEQTKRKKKSFRWVHFLYIWWQYYIFYIWNL